MNDIEFLRCHKPVGAIGNPTLIIFSDASSLAYGACAYIRYKVQNGSYVSNLLTAKCKMAPIKSLTIPRLELLGAIVSARLGASIVKEMKCTFNKTFHIVDSAIVRSQIQKESYGFGTFTSTKIAEIQNKTNTEDWWWISGNMNPADLVTRPATIKDLGKNSLWQCGPHFLSMPFDMWPIKKDPVNDLPDRVKVYSINSEVSDSLSLSCVIDFKRFRCYYKMI